jgi:hypothetical protein
MSLESTLVFLKIGETWIRENTIKLVVMLVMCRSNYPFLLQTLELLAQVKDKLEISRDFIMSLENYKRALETPNPVD